MTPLHPAAVPDAAPRKVTAVTRSKTPVLVPVLLCASLLMAGCDQRDNAAAGPGGPPGGPPGMAGGMALNVIAAPVNAENFVDRYTALGTAQARESINVTARVSSIVSRVAFTEGQQIRAGELLVELDTRETKANVALAEATLQQSRSQFRRSQALSETRIVSEADVEQLEAQVRIAEAQLDAAATRLDMLYVRAPFNGTIGLRYVSLGEQVGPETVITTLDDTTTIRLEFSVPESFMGTLRTGMTIRARSAIYPGESFDGVVKVLDSRVDPVTRAITAIADIPNPDGRLRPGMFMTVTLERDRPDVLLVAEEALIPRQGRQYLFVVEDGRAVEREVQLGSRAPGLVEIRQGLESGDIVITEGVQRVRPGSRVNILEPAGTPVRSARP